MNSPYSDVLGNLTKKLLKKIEEVENNYDVSVVFENIYGLHCQIFTGNKELKEFNVYDEDIKTKAEKNRMVKDYIERWLENDIRNIPEVQLAQFIKMLNNDDFAVGDSFWIGDHEFEVKK